MGWLHGGAGNPWLSSAWEPPGTPLALRLALGEVLSPPQAPNLLLPLVSHPSKALSSASAPKICSWQRTRGAKCLQHPAQRTCEDGLVNPQRGGADFDDADVCWHLVTDCKEKSRAAQSEARKGHGEALEVLQRHQPGQQLSRTFRGQDKQPPVGSPARRLRVKAAWPPDSHCLLPTEAHVSKQNKTKKKKKEVLKTAFPAGFPPPGFLACHSSSSCSLIA